MRLVGFGGLLCFGRDSSFLSDALSKNLKLAEALMLVEDLFTEPSSKFLWSLLFMIILAMPAFNPVRTLSLIISSIHLFVFSGSVAANTNRRSALYQSFVRFFHSMASLPSLSYSPNSLAVMAVNT